MHKHKPGDVIHVKGPRQITLIEGGLLHDETPFEGDYRVDEANATGVVVTPVVWVNGQWVEAERKMLGAQAVASIEVRDAVV